MMKSATTILAFCVAALLALGSVTLYSAVMASDPGKFFHQMRYLALGSVVCVVLALVDYRVWRSKVIWVMAAVVVVLLVLALVPGFSARANAASRWVRIAGVQFQPSDFARLALIIMVAAYAERYQRRMHTFRHGIVGPALIIGPIIGLILAGRDYSTTATLGAVVGTMVFIAGVRWLHMVAVLPLVVAGLIAAVAFTPYRVERVKAFLNPDAYAETTAVQNNRAAMALMVGGPLGKGLTESPFKVGTQNVPLHFSDFIFSVVGAEGGLLGTLGTALLYLGFLLCGVYIAWHARDMFGLLLATGISLSVAVQAFVHMGVVTGILPNTGFALPFMSHGGTNLVATLAAIGLLFSVARHGLVNIKARNPFERHVDVPVSKTA